LNEISVFGDLFSGPKIASSQLPVTKGGMNWQKLARAEPSDVND
jgi:hypothetical protein